MTKKPIPLSFRFSEALRGAADLHATQFRKGTTIPYVAHLLGVASIALQDGADEDEAIAALLHDAIEDAPRDLGANWVQNWLRFRFGERVLDIVEGCTDADVSPKPPWRARKEAYVARVRKEPASVILVSGADKLTKPARCSPTIARSGRRSGIGSTGRPRRPGLSATTGAWSPCTRPRPIIRDSYGPWTPSSYRLKKKQVTAGFGRYHNSQGGA